MKNIILILVLLSLGVAGGIFAYKSFSSQTQKEKSDWGYRVDTVTGSTDTYLQNQESKNEKAKEDTKIFNKAIETQQKDLCEKIEDNDLLLRCKEEFISVEAKTSGDPSLCDPIADERERILCRDAVIYEQALRRIDSSQCGLLVDRKMSEKCLLTVDSKRLNERLGSGSLDSEFCESLTPNVRSSCQENLRKDTESLTLQEAIEAKNLDKCDEISDQAIKDSCRDTILLDRAIRENDKNLCDMIVDIERGKYCTTALTARDERSLYASIIKSGNISQCREITTESLRNKCHDTLILSQVRTSGDTSSCSTLYNTGLTDRCQAFGSRE